jgi:hypothetical protein
MGNSRKNAEIALSDAKGHVYLLRVAPTRHEAAIASDEAIRIPARLNYPEGLVPRRGLEVGVGKHGC